MTIEKIRKKLNKSALFYGDEDFVAAAVEYNASNKEVIHSGIIICFEGQAFLFHYNGHAIELEEFPKNGNWYVDKHYDFIPSQDVIPFYYHCLNIKDEAKPSYGFNYNGSYFKGEGGSYFSEVEDFQFMTCVGFCLNVITGMIEAHTYILHEEWTLADSEKDPYFLEYMEAALEGVSKQKQDQLKTSQRRIFPHDYLACSLINEIPISKKDVDNLVPNLKVAIAQVFLN
jgi:hypothetical protein